jgi:DNA-binding transcriptional regulator WhiA
MGMNEDLLRRANERRAENACARTVPAALEAIDVIGRQEASPTGQQYLEVLFLRVDHPTLTLTQLAESMGISKAAYSSLLRRALLKGTA